jgi:hypothetical protein
VEVLRAEGLVKKGVFHTLDPRVELWTQTGMKVRARGDMVVEFGGQGDVMWTQKWDGVGGWWAVDADGMSGLLWSTVYCRHTAALLEETSTTAPALCV